MSDRYRLVALGDDQLLAALSGLVRREQDLLSDLLAHLAELDRRRLYLELGFPSLFAYCTEALGFCKSSAGRRIAAARVCRAHPEAFARVAQGELQLSVLSLLGAHLNGQNATELFEACSRKSVEQVEALLAARCPKPAVRDLIRRLPSSPASTPDVGSACLAAPSTVQAAPSTVQAAPSTVQAAPSTVQAAPSTVMPAVSRSATGPVVSEQASPQRVTQQKTGPAGAGGSAQGRIEPLSADRFGVHFTADAEFRELLEEVRALASHQLPKGDLLPLLKRGLQAYRRELQKERFSVGMASRRARTAKSESMGSAPRTRHVAAAVAREVYLRDSPSGCSFRAKDGRRCGARSFLELDHIEPWADGGESTSHNLRLRCRAHNQHAARARFGEQHMQKAIAQARDSQAARKSQT
jgi:HNH endonuclease